MSLDLRFPIGLLFTLLGVLLLLYGLASDPAIYQASLGINVNVWWGLVLAVFAGLALLGAHGHPDLAGTVDGRGHGVELEGHPGVGEPGVDAGHVQDAREPDEGARDHVGEHLDPVDLDPGGARGFLVAPDGVQVAPEPRVVEQVPGEGGDADHEDDRRGHPQHRALPEHHEVADLVDVLTVGVEESGAARRGQEVVRARSL